VQIPILSGVFTDEGPDFRVAYPVNLIPVPQEQGISQGYLRPADGIVEQAEGPGIDRGGINWNGTCYRVMGTKLVSVSQGGQIMTLGEVGPGGRVTFDYSFDRLAVASGGRLYYWAGSLTQVTDSDLGTVVDFIWIDGYFMTTDGENLIVTELNDPLAIDPTKYGASEIDPDPVVGLLKLQDEAYAINRHTIEVFQNIGGEGFPFQRIDGAQIEKGAVGTHAACVFQDFIAFMGGAQNEAISIYLGKHSQCEPIATKEIVAILEGYTETELSECLLEQRVYQNHVDLLVHLPDRTLVFDYTATLASKVSVWHVLTTTMDGFSQYRAQSLVRCYDRWLVADPQEPRIGYLDPSISTHWGENVRWEFGTLIVYNEGRGALFHELELVSLTGRVNLDAEPTISTAYSIDGETWSQDRFISAGNIGQRNKRLVWLQQGHMRNWRIQRFRGDSDAHVSFARLDARLEALAA
jgi:hypothetical protein